jgi:hypothetical protein
MAIGTVIFDIGGVAAASRFAALERFGLEAGS